ncbi:MAG: hypothetical protein JRI57_10225 [Deltaproteobacteria bacterium]|nr:hypothetical protein [Deltaproteobacteria bacterium]MBW1953413.1 hypothetical protein [Deltaproteobacteria bacterium]MBW1987562.1 hypothetical protein [Deltaproteobacteria bacterium]
MRMTFGAMAFLYLMSLLVPSAGFAVEPHVAALVKLKLNRIRHQAPGMSDAQQRVLQQRLYRQEMFLQQMRRQKSGQQPHDTNIYPPVNPTLLDGPVTGEVPGR